MLEFMTKLTLGTFFATFRKNPGVSAGTDAEIPVTAIKTRNPQTSFISLSNSCYQLMMFTIKVWLLYESSSSNCNPSIIAAPAWELIRMFKSTRKRGQRTLERGERVSIVRILNRNCQNWVIVHLRAKCKHTKWNWKQQLLWNEIESSSAGIPCVICNDCGISYSPFLSSSPRLMYAKYRMYVSWFALQSPPVHSLEFRGKEIRFLLGTIFAVSIYSVAATGEGRLGSFLKVSFLKWILLCRHFTLKLKTNINSNPTGVI